jgi:hypothetical protein
MQTDVGLLTVPGCGEELLLCDITRRVAQGMVPWVRTVGEDRARQKLLGEIRARGRGERGASS